ncbi:MAG: hypothetical protein IPN86_23480 [Saprospiraceae bacterium]|jgi:hypothetical protein|nr:hypothetical protein [Saprospiraceae bacterium]
MKIRLPIFLFLIIYACHSPSEFRSDDVNQDRFTYYDGPSLTWGIKDTTVLNVESKGELKSRAIVHRDLSFDKYLTKVRGTIAVEVCFNQEGNVTYATLIPKETTLKNYKVINSTLLNLTYR